MPILIYQLVIIATLILTRFLAPNRLLVASWIWTGMTLLNLFWPPLIVLQLIVIWGTFGLLSKSQKAPSPGASESGSTMDRSPTGNVTIQSSPTAKRDQPPPTPGLTSPATSPKTFLGGIQQGATKLSTAVDELNAYVNRQKQIQNETIEMLSAYKVERQYIEIALDSAEKRLELESKLDADQEFKELFAEALTKVQAAFNGTTHASTAAAPSEHKCVDLRLPSRDREPEIASAVERKYAEMIDDYSRFLKVVTQRLQRQEGLRRIFEERMLRIGGAQILKRIKSFEAGKEWTASAPVTLADLLPNPPWPGQTAISASLLNAFAQKALGEGNEQVVKAGANPGPTLLAPDEHAPNVSALGISASQEQSSTQVSQSLNADVTELPPYAPQGISLSDNEREEIKKTAIARRIPALYHFTRSSNLESILKHGLCSISRAGELDIKPHVNDSLRLDGYPDAVSLSIAFPNDRMFYKYRQTEPNEGWAVLAISPATLWSKNCAFCERNAADHRIRERPLADLMNAGAFRRMFEMVEGVAPRGEQRLLDCDPTDPQAEVLVFETIEPDQIVGVDFNSHKVLNAYSHLLGERVARVFERRTGPFGARAFTR